MTREEAITVMQLYKDELEHRIAIAKIDYDPGAIDLYSIQLDAFDVAIEELSAEAVPQSKQYKKGFEDAKRAFLIEYARESENMRKRNAQLEVMLNAQKAISAEAVSGEEYEETDGVIKIKKQSAKDVGEIKHIVVCSPNYTRYFYNDSMPTQYKGGEEE